MGKERTGQKEVKHHVSVERELNLATIDRWLFIPVCRCGWRGQRRDSRPVAKQDALEHKYAHVKLGV